MGRLDSVSLQGFKSIADLQDLPLTARNVLIGPNGAGKSNFIQVFGFLNAIREGRLQEYVARSGGANRLLTFGSSTTKRMRIRLSFDNEVNGYELTLAASEDDSLVPQAERVLYWRKGEYKAPGRFPVPDAGKEAGISASKQEKIGAYVQGHLASWRVYHYQDSGITSPMKKAAEIHNNRRLEPDGSNLAPFLHLLRERHETEFAKIRHTIQLIAPFFGDFVLEPLALKDDSMRLEWKHAVSGQTMPPSSLSDGTLRFIALATLLLQPRQLKPTVIVIDEPELGLHPVAIRTLGSLIRKASQEVQVIVSTQSPYLLDEFDPEDVVVADLVDGKTKLHRPNADELRKWLNDYSLGQLWEQNRLGGRPG